MIETKRLRLYAASQEQMKAFIAAQTVDVLKAAYTEMLDGCLAHPDQWEWYAIWMMDLKGGTHIGELCFKGITEKGAAEIGYGVAEDYQGCGYATEAVTALSDWALSQPSVMCVVAETEASNIASQKVLGKAGFVPTGEVGEEGPLFVRKKDDIRTKIVEALRATQRESIENVIDYMDRNGFYTEGCHKHHRYKGGLADHSWEVFQHALLLSKCDNDIDKHSLAICALLHDFCKCSGMYEYGGHGRRSVHMLQALGLHLSDEEFLAIRYHMGQRGRKMDAKRLKALNCKYRKYVHKADNMSSVLGWTKDFVSRQH